MAQSLEKAFLQKVAQMPQDELELPPPPPRMKLGKPGKKGRGNFALNSLIKTDYILAKDMSPCMSTGFKFDFFSLDLLPPFLPVSLFFFSLWRSDNSSSGASCLPVCVLPTYARNARLPPVHPSTDSFDEELAPFLFYCTNHRNHYRPPSNAAHC